MNVKLNISTSDHPETDGQSEVMVKTLSNMIRRAIQEDPHIWHQILSTLEFEYNSSKNASTGLVPFEVDIGRIPHTPSTRKLADCGVRCQMANDLIDRMNAYRLLARDNLAESQSRQKFYADQTRRTVVFKEGDLVLLRNEDLGASDRANIPKKW